MRNQILFLLLYVIVLSGCASGSAAPASVETVPTEAPVAAQATQTQPAPTLEPSPTATETAFGGGPSPLLAVWGYEGEQFVIRVIQFGQRGGCGDDSCRGLVETGTFS